jgi:hypothetical protein
MTFLERLKAKTPEKHKGAGQVATTLATISGAILATGIVINPIGIACLTIVTALFGGKALYHGQKVE